MQQAQPVAAGGVSHASPSGANNVPSQLAETQAMPDTPTPTRWRSRDMMQPIISDRGAEIMSIDEKEGR
ncbi:uncharacterized protein ASPGLDRAFT_41271 [Aspergillus glaucus CBS 516.65]|uniref:Uncharacterized protein n=1 Tax=Aspergillus glaucus CBS 516.65 TaxID=1160497 RepID=A0A1L9VZF7_ASPGL|nr:hypothetical protein ASPGLDRAFT_41271 [Aspergillus glaucus CBS 516.65]OJJ89310.1 hypothetical protein ASPGLDRAFT_41271 [Aspergillus glaucus CBS 516.65]